MDAKEEFLESLLTHVRQLHTPAPAPPRVVHRRQPLNLKAEIGLVLDAIVFVLPLAIDTPHLDEPDECMLAILLLAIAFWITKPIALSATTVLIIGLEVIIVSNRALVDPTLDDAALVDQMVSCEGYFATLANLVIILFMGGFMIAGGTVGYGLDRDPTTVMFKPFLRNARPTILELMLITAVLSMFMSNTATTATIFAVVIPTLATPPKGKARVGVALFIPLVANVGGTGISVDTPPNAIAIGALAEKGITTSFIQWMILAIPFMLVILLASQVFLSLMFIPKSAEVNIEMSISRNRSFTVALFYIAAGTTILLWMTKLIHGVSSTVVGLLPVVVLLSLGAMTGEDTKELDWLVSQLMAGGIALDERVGATGLGTQIVGSIPWDSFGPVLIVAITSLIGFAIADVISHSVSANLLIPLVVTLAVSPESVDTMTVVVIAAIVCLLGMPLLISTPPNTITCSTGEVKVKEMAILGIVAGSVSTIVLVLVTPPL